MTPAQAAAIRAMAREVAASAPDPSPEALAVVRGVIAEVERERRAAIKAQQ